MIRKILLAVMLSITSVFAISVDAIVDVTEGQYVWDGVEYKTIFRDEDGVFHGILEVQGWETIKDDSMPVSTMVFDLTRDTVNLRNIHIKYESDNRFLFWTLGEKDIYEMNVDYSNMSKELNLGNLVGDLQKYDAAVWKMNEEGITAKRFGISKTYYGDYALITNYNAPVSDILEFEFDYLLPDYEVDNVNEELKVAQELEIAEVVNDTTLTDEEKYLAIQEIQDAYDNAYIDYGEILTYIGNAEDLAIAKGEILTSHVESINTLLNSFTSALDEFIHYLVKMIGLVFVGVFGFMALILSFTFLKPVMAGLGKFLGRIAGLLALVGLLEYFGVWNIHIYHDIASYIILVKDATILLVSDLSNASAQLGGMSFTEIIGGLIK